VVIGFLTQIGFVTLAVGFILLLVGLVVWKPSRDVMGKFFRVAVGCLGVVVVTVTILVVVAVRYGAPALEDPAVRDALEEALRDVIPAEAVEVGPAAAGEDTPGGAPGDTSAAIDTLAAAADTVPADTLAAAEPPPEPGDTSVAADTALPAPALDSIARLNLLVEALTEERDDSRDALRSARRELAGAEDRGPLQWLWDLVEELGLGFGWGALYLTVTHTWWKGTSVGKKLLRIRVVMIDKRPLSLWLSFERVGGYAAGFATGLLGFAQIFWDPNRQAIHDKVSETIVIQDGKEPVPGPWIKEGQAQWRQGRSGAGEPGRP
jgi:hypothetical protein